MQVRLPWQHAPAQMVPLAGQFGHGHAPGIGGAPSLGWCSGNSSWCASKVDDVVFVWLLRRAWCTSELEAAAVATTIARMKDFIGSLRTGRGTEAQGGRFEAEKISTCSMGSRTTRLFSSHQSRSNFGRTRETLDAKTRKQVLETTWKGSRAFRLVWRKREKYNSSSKGVACRKGVLVSEGRLRQFNI